MPSKDIKKQMYTTINSHHHFIEEIKIRHDVVDFFFSL